MIDLLPEAERNPLLRRVDWRFLLADPTADVVAHAVNGSLARALPAVGRRVVHLRDAAPGSVALVVLADPDRATLASAVRALAPGGSCYCEWRGAGARGGAGAVRALRAAGLVHVSAHWPWPWRRADAAYWLPLGCEPALDWFRVSRPPATGLGELRRRLAVGAWRAARRGGLLRPVCAVGVRPGPGAVPWLTRVAAAHAPAEAAPGADASWLLLTGGRRSSSKVVALGFGAGDRRPRLAVKVGRAPEAEEGLRREAAALRALGEAGEAQGVPRMLFAAEDGGRTLIGQAFEAGVPLSRQLTEATQRELALAVTDWLVGLARRSPGRSADWRRRLVDEPLEQFARRYGPALEPGSLERTRRALAAIRDVPAAIEQRDCAPWNVLRRPDGSLTVLDWESAEPRGLAGMDLVYYLTFAGLFLAGAIDRDAAPAYRALRRRATPAGRVAAECERRYASALGIDPATLHALRLLAWIVHSRAEHDRLVIDAAGEPGPVALRSATFVELWREELNRGPDG